MLHDTSKRVQDVFNMYILYFSFLHMPNSQKIILLIPQIYIKLAR